ncbi:hypothetical protein VKS41_006377 [Umbelopsis sp. WA50703]
MRRNGVDLPPTWVVSHNAAVTALHDACPECKYGSLDLTPAVFDKLGNPETGELDITWTLA